MIDGMKAAKPLLADRLAQQLATPYARYLGLDLLQWGAGRAVTRMSASPRIARSVDDPRPHPLTLVGMIDDAFAMSLSSLIASDTGMSTLDLRIAFSAQDPVAGEIVNEITALMLDDRAGQAEVKSYDATGHLVAVGTALFSVGSFPGGGVPETTDVGKYDPSGETAPFLDFMAFEGSAESPTLPGTHHGLLGWEAGRKLHGGAIGALLMAACEGRLAAEGDTDKRIATLSVTYHRAAGQRPLFTQSEMLRRGRAASLVRAECWQDAGRIVASAQATVTAR